MRCVNGFIGDLLLTVWCIVRSVAKEPDPRRLSRLHVKVTGERDEVGVIRRSGGKEVESGIWHSFD